MDRFTTDDSRSRERSSIAHNFGLRPPGDGDHAALVSAAASWNDAQSRWVRASGARIAKVEEARRRFRDAMSREVSADASRRFREFAAHQRDALRALLRAGDSANRHQVARNAREQSLGLMSEAGVNRERLRALYGSFKRDPRRSCVRIAPRAVS